ncbi:MAG: flagellar hook assembly protein FlgD [Proteobacteria bacterium]|nr:flagellar hook assembly protein FlgD [Pseudomonadota bacterium]
MSSVQNNPGVTDALMNAVNGSKSSTSASGIQETQDRFMKLLLTQVQNQDPLNPLDNAQMTSQLAQMSTVSGIEKLNSTLQTLMGDYQASQSMQSAALIGHGVLVPGTSAHLQNGQAIMGMDLAGPADKVTVTVRDAAGNAVHKIDLGGQDAGTIPLAWDGKTDSGATAPDGNYTFEVDAVRGSDAVTATRLAFGQVASVSTGSQGVKINIAGLGAVAFSDVRQIL